MEETITKVINLYGGPGAGKSTLAARIFSELKEMQFNCELVTEYAKDVTWEQSFRILENQIYVFGKQQHRMWRLSGKVDYIVTDSPLPLCLIYGEHTTSNTFKKLIMEEYGKYENIDIFLERIKRYNPKGRNQSEDEAKEIDRKIFNVLNSIKTNEDAFDLIVDGSVHSVPQILNFITKV